jgi:hypothetical protein
MKKINIIYSGCGFTDMAGSWGDFLKNNLGEFEMEDENIDIVTGGDSFTDEAGSWSRILKDDNKYFVHNSAQGSAGNDLITRSIFYKTVKLLDKGITPIVFIQLSALSRMEFLVNPIEQFNMKKYKLGYGGQPFTNFIEEINTPAAVVDFEFEAEKGFDDVWIKSPGVNALEGGIVADERLEKFWKTYYYNFYNDEMALMRTLENILRLQYFFKNNNIKYKFFFGWKQFSDEYPTSHTKHLWDEVDWDNFWFHKEYGGITQWAEDNFSYEERYADGGDFHPSKKVHSEFSKRVVSSWIEELKDE